MEQTLEEKIAARLAELPADVRTAITGSGLNAKVHTISAKYRLHIDQEEELENQLYLAMLGFSPLEDLPENLAVELGLTAETALAITTEINNEILSPIRESLKATSAPKEIHPADMMLSQKTVTTAPPVASVPPPTANKPLPTPPAPKPYTTDPYREPTN